MSAKRWLYSALGLTVVGVGAVTTMAAQSVFPVRLDDGESVSEVSPEGVAVPLAAGSGASALTVEGEVLTLGPGGEPRLWGRGRPGTVVYISEATSQLCRNGSVRFGLSGVITDWGSAEDACPAGTWVCTAQERGLESCDTKRFDYGTDGRYCDGSPLSFDSDKHLGWLADQSGEGLGASARENGVLSFRVTCDSLPVWCCTD